ncbi:MULTISPECIES: thioredoxin [unclassified Desulfovibrio]|uniref:thioredoxin n=1 Tax=unclassified Desulfovibrio TaxID=2593640 RepID=UPI0013EC4DAC|nr:MULTISPECIES: thioredoxin [unclassified Desulfovibrio]
MEYALGAICVIFLIFLLMESKRKAARIVQAVAVEKSRIADDSGMTASLGVFTPDTQTTVIIGASEELGVFYYRMLRQSKVIIRSRINLANLARVELLVNSQPVAIASGSEQPTTSLRATEIADRTISLFSTDAIRNMQRAGLRVVFFDESGTEKSLEITSLRAEDERHKFERVQLLKTTIWWVAFLQMASRQARQVRARLAPDTPA